MTADEYEERFGSKPLLDDLQRVNCSRPGTIGHLLCGVCEECNRPKFQCDCPTKSPQTE